MSDEPKTCTKCKGEMEKGTLQQAGRFGETPFTWEASDETRIKLVAYRCKECGFVEVYAPSKTAGS